MVDVKKTDWMESVRLVFDYFCERTPRSFVEFREASIVWNYKCAPVHSRNHLYPILCCIDMTQDTLLFGIYFNKKCSYFQTLRKFKMLQC